MRKNSPDERSRIASELFCSMSLQENSGCIPFHSELPVKENAGLFFKKGDLLLKSGHYIFKGKLSSLKSGRHILKGGHYILKEEVSLF
ncbi:MAG: hypothetical protein Q3M30_15440 [Candidatus Electrothrix sp. Rat3]|nr:hypothetical protein [Candidatus Electrothrix rattekaaiensis]